jgi:long-chain acyl-CoA synthetase
MGNSGFFAAAGAAPGRVALIDPSGAATTAGDLVAGINRATRGIGALGLRPGDTVAVLLPNRRELLEIYGAAIQSGLYFVAINWHLGDQEIAYILEDSETSLLVYDAQFVATARQAATRARIPDGRVLSVESAPGVPTFEELVAGLSSEPPERPAPGQIMFYTSGTTGRPKGVRKVLPAGISDEIALVTGIGLRGPAAPAGTAGINLPTDMVALSSGPYYHALPIGAAVSALDAGAKLVMMDRWTPERFLELVGEHRVTNATMVPTMFHRLLALPDDVRQAADISSLRAVNHAGAPCSIDVKRRMIEWFGPIISEGYSSTEGAGTSVTSEEWLRKPGTVGRPAPGVDLKILDEDGHQCPTGTPGLVYLSPALWEFEYHGDAEKTHRARRDGLFTVGDIGYLDEDGYLFLCDRQADTIISGGVNIYPAEVEAALLQHPAVKDVAVIGVPSDEWGEEVRAVVEPAGGLPVPDRLGTELVEFCRVNLAHFKCPRRVDFVPSVGRDPNGKLRKGLIRDRYWQGRERRI